MNKTEGLDPWVTYLEWDVLGSETPGGFAVWEVVVKVRPEGLLGIVKVSKGGKGLVAFVGGRGLATLSRAILHTVKDERTRWREDKYYET